MILQFAGKTDVGRLRSCNQDDYRYGTLGGSDGFAVLCDGMGGERSGNIASSMTCDLLEQRIRDGYREGMSFNSIRNLLLTAVTAANAKVHAVAGENQEMLGMGTTVVAAIWSGETVCLVNVGDSRAYTLSPGEITQITKDHSLVQMLVDQGVLTTEEAQRHPDKNLITRAIGADETVEADYFECDMEPGRCLLLCSDGLTNHCPEEEILSLMQGKTPEAFCDALITAANDAGGRDNITVLVLTKDERGTGEERNG